MKNLNKKVIIASIIFSLILSFSIFPNNKAEAASTKTAYVGIKSGVLNVRSKASTNSKIVGTLKKGAKLQVYSVSKGWAKIDYKNKKRYVSNEFLRYYKKMSEETAKKIYDRIMKIQYNLQPGTKKQIQAQLKYGFTDSFIKKLYKHDLIEYDTDYYGNTVYGWREGDYPRYYIMYGIKWDYEYSYYDIEAPKITYYKKGSEEYLLLSQKYPNDELYSNVEQKIYLVKSSSKASWKVYNTSW